MKYTEIIPGERLKPYIKCYYSFESDAAVEMNDTVFPGGDLEIIFNLGEGIWKSAVDDVYYTTPQVELWGKLTQPLAIKSTGKHKMLGIKFYAHSATCFLNDPLPDLNNQVNDLKDLLGPEVRDLHGRLKEEQIQARQVQLIETFLLKKLGLTQKKAYQVAMIGRIVNEMKMSDGAEELDRIAARHHISSRYLGKLFLQYTGVTPKLYYKINRFHQSLQLVAENQSSLTAIAYECGYFDQSHFIRDFKYFAGVTPSAYLPELYPVAQALASN